MQLKLRFSILLALLTMGCSQHTSQVQIQRVESDPIEEAASIQLEDMTLRQKIAQMIMVRIRGKFYNSENWYRNQLEGWIRDDQIGGVITFGGNIHGSFYNIQQYQHWASIPLLVAADYERGTGQWLTGGTLFPSNMAMAATQDPDLAYEQGRVTAAEGKKLGVHISFSPVMDVNNNKDNPIINFRAYSDDAETVAEFGSAFIRGMQDQGMSACAKHFPGHGNTAVDSHTQLPSIKGTRSQLEAVELLPFKQAVEVGVKMIMVGHIAMPGIDPSGAPASHSYPITTGILRDEWGFDGIIVTDGMEMGGLTSTTWAGESAVRTVEAGADILLLPMDVGHTIDAIERAVRTGRLQEKRIDESVRRILKMKRDAGIITSGDSRSWEEVESGFGIEEYQLAAVKAARASITVVKDSGHLPLKPERIRKLHHLILTTDEGGSDQLSTFVSDISHTHGNVNEIFVNEPLSELRIEDVLERIKGARRILVSMLVRIKMNKGQSTIDPTHAELLRRISDAGVDIVAVGFGSPYLPDYQSLDTYICAYGYGAVSQNAAADAIWGRISIQGTLPVQLSGEYPRGHGVSIPKRTWGFEPADRKWDLAPAWDILETAIQDSIFPGAQVFIAKDGQVIANQGFGRQTYAVDAPEIDTKTIYDTASLTKVLATTPIVMKMLSRKEISLDQEVSQFFPEFTRGGKEQVTLRHLLTHSSGLKPFEQYFLDNEINTKADVLSNILDQELQFTPGSQFMYSDLGMILLGEIIEMVRRKSIDQLARQWVFSPMGLTNTSYRPGKELLPRIAPTEIDQIYRNRLVHGEVHDENAWMLGGAAPHAGVFSTAEDIGKYGQMMLNEGTWLGSRLFSKWRIREFIRRQEMPPGSDRAIGWDTPSRNGRSSAGDYFSHSSYGHLGFTGTSLWIDPKTDIIVVLLTNRVHPTRERGGMWAVRRSFHNEVMKILQDS